MEVIELLKEIKEKLDVIDKRLSRIEEMLAEEELSEEEIRELEEIAKACEEGKMKTYSIEEAKKILGL
jgi:acetylglutamate kinase